MMDEVQTFKFDYEDYAISVRVEASNDDGITANRMDLMSAIQQIIRAAESWKTCQINICYGEHCK
jgi:hypothetical protein